MRSSSLPYRYIHTLWWLCLLLGYQGTLIAGPLPAWEIDSSWYYQETSHWTPVEPFVGIHYDPDKVFSVEQALAGDIPFQALDPTAITNLWEGQIWATLQFRNTLPIPASWAFLMHADRAEVYLSQPDSSWALRQLGSNLPQSEWDALQHRPLYLSPYILQLELPAGAEQRMLIRLSQRSLHPWFELRAMSRPNFLSLSSNMFANNNWVQGIFHGMCWMMVFFSFGTFFLKKDRTYLFLALYILCVSVYLFFQMEMDKTWDIAEFPRLSRMLLNASLNGIVAFYALLVIHFLHSDGWRPDIKKLVRYYFYAGAFGGLVTTTLLGVMPLERYNMTINVWLLFPLPLLGLFGLLYICYNYLRSSNMLARFFAINNLFLFFGSLIFYYWSYTGLVAFREAETYLWPVWIMQAGFILQLVALVLSIGYQGLQIEREKFRLAEIDHVKSRFFANISHEFRTPLTLILGPIQEMKKRTRDSWLQEQLQIMHNNARRLLKLINQILDLARLDSGKAHLELQRSDIAALARALTFSFQSLAEQQAIKLHFEAEPREIDLVFDREKIEQVLLNLLSNALKYTPKAGQISVQLEEKPRWIQLIIHNSGPGIPPQHLPHLFERFYQAHSPGYTTDQPSTGIGLALSKEWVHLHGGKIEAESRTGERTTFRVRLPKGLDESTATTAVKPYPSGSLELQEEPTIRQSNGTRQDNAFSERKGRQPQLLVVEDNPDIRTYIHQCLAATYQIQEVADGLAGLETATAHIPDLVITDVMMPKMDGFELCRRLKSQDATSHIPVILLTGKASRDSRLEGLATQADDFLAKPFDADELRLRISNLLHNRALWRKRYEHSSPLDPSPVEVPSREQAFLQQAKEVIETYLGDEHFTVEQLSDALALDRTQLFRKLRALTGQNPSRFIRTIRLRRARQLLEARAGTAAEIGFMVGFSSPSYFSKCFKEEFGMTPGEVA